MRIRKKKQYKHLSIPFRGGSGWGFEFLASLSRNKLRTTLTGFAVAWGIFMLIFLLGAGNGLINAQMLSRDRFLNNSMTVYGEYTSKPYDGLKENRSIELNNKDVDITRNSFKNNIEEVGVTVAQDGLTISKGENYVNGSLYGVYPNDTKIDKKEMLYGRFINEIDFEQQRKVIVLSENDAKELMPKQISALIGQYVDVSGIAFKVVGIYKADKTGRNASSYTAFTTFRSIYNKGDKVGNIIFSFKGLETMKANEDFEAQYRARINANHRAAPDDEEAIWLWNRFTQNLQMDTGMGIIRTALWVIGLFTLLSGIVGVSNIMLITVKERTREFGIRKAIGAKPASILRLIIIESVVITTFFGYIGMILGIAANQYMDATIGNTKIESGGFEATMFYNPTVGIDVCVSATVVMILAGTIAGLVPARKAAKIRPIEALRAE